MIFTGIFAEFDKNSDSLPTGTELGTHTDPSSMFVCTHSITFVEVFIVHL